ncbi:MAG: hypothetical protein ACYDEY_15705 [Acidimicrobiales bacterium]
MRQQEQAGAEALAELRRMLWCERMSPASGVPILAQQTVMVEALAVAAELRGSPNARSESAKVDPH